MVTAANVAGVMKIGNSVPRIEPMSLSFWVGVLTIQWISNVPHPNHVYRFMQLPA